MNIHNAEKPEMLYVHMTVGYIVATVSCLALIGYSFMVASATGHRFGIAAEFDGWGLVNSLPFGFASGDYLAAIFGIAIAATAVAISHYKKKWAWVVCAVAMFLPFLAVFVFLVRVPARSDVPRLVMLLSVFYFAPLLFWGSIAREYMPHRLRDLRACMIRKHRDRMSDFDRRSGRRGRSVARRYADYAIIWGSVGGTLGLILLFGATRASLSPLQDLPLQFTMPGGDQVVWVLRAESSGYFVLSRDSEDLRWIAASEVLAISPSEWGYKKGGYMATRIEQVEDAVPAMVVTVIGFVLLVLIWSVRIYRRDKRKAAQRQLRRISK